MNAIRGKTRTINLTLFYYMMPVHIFTGRTVSRFKFVKCFISCGCTSINSSSGYSFGVATKIIAIPAITSGTARSITRSTASDSAALRDLLRICKTICHGTHIAEGAKLLAVRQTVFGYKEALCSGTDPSLRLLL